MGMYDTVTVPCPQCGTLSDFQSKSGDCKLNEFTLADAPDDVLRDINRHAPNTCAKCGVLFGVEIEGPSRTLTARPVIWTDVEKEKRDGR
jgi:hypothetical protein